MRENVSPLCSTLQSHHRVDISRFRDPDDARRIAAVDGHFLHMPLFESARLLIANWLIVMSSSIATVYGGQRK